MTNTSWAMAILSYVDRTLLYAISSRAIRIIDNFESSQGISNLAWAMSKLACVDSPLFAALSSQARARIGVFGPQSLANMAWSYAVLL